MLTHYNLTVKNKNTTLHTTIVASSEEEAKLDFLKENPNYEILEIEIIEEY